MVILKIELSPIVTVSKYDFTLTKLLALFIKTSFFKRVIFVYRNLEVEKNSD
jgi:hypothetical protein